MEKIDRISVAFKFFPELFERRVEILNAWIDRAKVLEIDVYGNPFLETKSTCSAELNGNLDEKYIAHKNNKQILGDKRIEFKPVGSQNS